MPDIPADIDSARMDELRREFSAGRFPQSLAIRSAEGDHIEIVAQIGRLLLGDAGWAEGRHPDLLFAGEGSLKLMKPPSIDECREFMSDICLRPVMSERRLGVVMFADQLLLPAANSLLKITEEQPAHVYLLFMLRNDTLLPTLKSRVRYVPMSRGPGPAGSEAMPRGDGEWLEWGGNVRDVPDIAASLERWGNYALEDEGDSELAFRIEGVRLLLDSGKLSKPMAQDLVLLALKEGISVERLFGNFW